MEDAGSPGLAEAWQIRHLQTHRDAPCVFARLKIAKNGFGSADRPAETAVPKKLSPEFPPNSFPSVDADSRP